MTGVGAIFDAALPGFRTWSPWLWDRVGEATAAAADLRAGQRVLDACCGLGAAAVPAAHTVGREGHVDAVDLAGALIDAGRRSNEAAQLHLHAADVTTWTAPDPYDAVLCAFGIFFLPDMDAGGRHLLGLLRLGGRIVVTTWSRGAVDPLLTPLARAVEEVGGSLPDSSRSRAAAAAVDHPHGLEHWLTGIGASDVHVRDLRFDVPLDDELRWSFVTGSGARTLIDGLDPVATETVRERYLHSLHAEQVDALDVRVHLGIGSRPSRDDHAATARGTDRHQPDRT